MADANNTVIDLTPDGGIKKEIITQGRGDESPPPNSQVSVHYVGTLLDGTKFDSSRDRDEKFKFKIGMGQVIKGWDVGVASMKRGEKAVLTCTSDYAYGDAGKPPTIPEKATLVFEVELFDWAEEEVTSDGLITKVKSYEAGQGNLQPNDGATCKVKYTGILAASGAVFSPEQEREIIIGEDEQIPHGMNTILKHMKKGQKSRFRILPSEHHFDEFTMPDGVKPEDELFLDVELVEFTKQKESWQMSLAEKLEFGALSKKRGNEAFKKQRFMLASKKYELGISTLENENAPDDASDEEKKSVDEIVIACWNNLANIQLREKKFSDVISNCTKVLEREGSNVKSLYRRSVAYFHMGKFSESLADIKQARKADKTNKLFISHQQTVKQRVEAEKSKQKAMYQKMFANRPKSENVADNGQSAPVEMDVDKESAETAEAESVEASA